MTGDSGSQSLELAEVLADITSKRDLADRLERYAKAKDRNLLMAEYITEFKTQYKTAASKMRDCSSWLVFRDYFALGEVKLSMMNSCHQHLLCQPCAIRRGARLLSRYFERYQAIMASDGSLRPFLVTLTVKDGEDLGERFKHLQKSVQSYHKRRHGKRDICEAKKATGAVWSYESKRGKNSGLWHPHVHAIWLCHEQPSQAQLSTEWKKITKDSYIVDVRPIDLKNPITGFLEVFKYALKFSDLSPEDNFHAYETFKGRTRLLGSFGEFYGISDEENKEDPYEGEPYIEYLYRYLEGEYSLNSITEKNS